MTLSQRELLEHFFGSDIRYANMEIVGNRIQIYVESTENAVVWQKELAELYNMTESEFSGPYGVEHHMTGEYLQCYSLSVVIPEDLAVSRVEAVAL